VTARRTERVLAVLFAVTVLAAWLVSQLSPAWTPRYFAVVLGPAVLLAAAAIVRARRLGLVALVVVLFLWWGFSVKDDKENAKEITARLAPSLHPGEFRDLDASRAGSRPPLLPGDGPRFATTLGPVRDDQVFDWRDAVDRPEAAQPAANARRAASTTVPRGSEFVVISPVFATIARGRRPGRDSSGRRRSSGTPCSPGIGAFGSSIASSRTRSRSSATTSSRSKPSFIAALARLGHGSGPWPIHSWRPRIPRTLSSSAAGRQD
jgi:hypothetical protein